MAELDWLDALSAELEAKAEEVAKAEVVQGVLTRKLWYFRVIVCCCFFFLFWLICNLW